MPQPGNQTTIRQLPTSGANGTHWRFDVVCTGCSSWGTSSSLNPTSKSQKFAHAASAKTVSTPSDPNSRFTEHDNKGTFQLDLNDAKVADLASLVKPSSASAASATPKPARRRA